MLAIDIKFIMRQWFPAGAMFVCFQAHLVGKLPVTAEREEGDCEVSSQFADRLSHLYCIYPPDRFHSFSFDSKLAATAELKKDISVIFPRKKPLHYNPRNQRRRALLSRILHKSSGFLRKFLKVCHFCENKSHKTFVSSHF